MTSPIHSQLIELAKQTVAVIDSPEEEARLRKAVSTAYYALFHLLIHDAMELIVHEPQAAPARIVFSRAFAHTTMKVVCRAYSTPGVQGAVPEILRAWVSVTSPELTRVASVFSELYLARELADYDVGHNPLRTNVEVLLSKTETAFQDWEIAKATVPHSVQIFSMWMLTFKQLNSR